MSPNSLLFARPTEDLANNLRTQPYEFALLSRFLLPECEFSSQLAVLGFYAIHSNTLLSLRQKSRNEGIRASNRLKQ
jgi:hypothetical protein